MPKPRQTDPNPPAPFTILDSEAAYRHFVPLVAHITDLAPWNADIDVLRVNIGRGVDNIREHRAHLTEHLPKLPFDALLEMPALVLAIGYADERVVKPASDKEIATRQKRMRPWRRVMLAQLEVFADPALGWVSAELVRQIRANSGPLDEARDAVSVSGIFREHRAAWTGKHPFTDAQVEALAADGNWLLVQLETRKAMPEATAPSPEAIVRDQLYTELTARYDDLFKAGVEIYGRRKVEEMIPAPMSRVVTRTPEPPASPPPGGTTP